MSEEKQKWYCESCGAEGVVRFEKGAGVWEVASKIRDDHERIAPNCTKELTRVRCPQG